MLLHVGPTYLQWFTYLSSCLTMYLQSCIYVTWSRTYMFTVTYICTLMSDTYIYVIYICPFMSDIYIYGHVHMYLDIGHIYVQSSTYITWCRTHIFTVMYICTLAFTVEAELLTASCSCGALLRISRPFLWIHRDFWRMFREFLRTHYIYNIYIH